jgi:hypothetical protein
MEMAFPAASPFIDHAAGRYDLDQVVTGPVAEADCLGSQSTIDSPTILRACRTAEHDVEQPRKRHPLRKRSMNSMNQQQTRALPRNVR